MDNIEAFARQDKAMNFPFPHNQPTELADINLYASDPALKRAVERAGAGWRTRELLRQGAEYGAAATLRLAEDAEHYAPELRTFSPTGERIDVVQFHPAWDHFMTMARGNGLTNLPYAQPRAGVWTAYGASFYLHVQIESGSACPTNPGAATKPGALCRRLAEAGRYRARCARHSSRSKTFHDRGHGHDGKTGRQRPAHE